MDFARNTKKIKMVEPTEFSAISGMGIQSTIQGKHVLIGNRTLMNQKNIKIADTVEEEIQAFENLGKT